MYNSIDVIVVLHFGKIDDFVLCDTRRFRATKSKFQESSYKIHRTYM